jgi:ABC-type nitrate/sulfonate/bicarbonate transport system substrate-binding protein
MCPSRALASELRTVGVRPAQAQVPGGREALDGADLGDDQQREVAADAADLAEHPDAVSALAR